VCVLGGGGRVGLGRWSGKWLHKTVFCHVELMPDHREAAWRISRNFR
jgi:hypothetical protein